jgi:tetratricopeptide (TPR) repeat protein
LEIDPDHINAAYARGACENKRGNFDAAIEDYHMALEKDKEKPTSPNQRLSARSGNKGYQPIYTRNNGEDHTLNAQLPTFEQSQKNLETEHRSTHSQFSESPMMVGRDMSGYGNKNMLLSPGGQINNMSNAKMKREDSMTSNATLALAKQHSDGMGYDRSNPMHRLSKASSISSSTANLQNTPHEETKSNMSTPATPNYSQNHSPSHPNHYRMLKKEAEGLHSQGYAARKKGDYQTAIVKYTQALEVLPTHFKALFNRGFAFDKIGNYDQAIEDYTKAIEIDPQNAFTYYNKGKPP